MENLFKAYAQVHKPKIEVVLDVELEKMTQEFVGVSSDLAPLIAAFVKGCGGGKRIRAIIVALGYELLAGNVHPDVYKAGVSYELFQTAVLAHDDIIDRSERRRGVPTMYRALGGDHRAISHTICLGDAGYFWSFKLLSEMAFSPDRIVHAIHSFSDSMLQTGIGEILDVEVPYLENRYSEENTLKVSEMKTAWYTVAGPMQLGAILAGANAETLEQIADFGRALGVAFQIQDDIIGVFADADHSGKSNTEDITEGKSTQLIVHALAHSTPSDKAFLEAHYGNPAASPDAIREVRAIFERTGSRAHASTQARTLAEKAKSILQNMAGHDHAKDVLLDLAEYLVTRKK